MTVPYPHRFLFSSFVHLLQLCLTLFTSLPFLVLLYTSCQFGGNFPNVSLDFTLTIYVSLSLFLNIRLPENFRLDIPIYTQTVKPLFTCFTDLLSLSSSYIKLYRGISIHLRSNIIRVSDMIPQYYDKILITRLNSLSRNSYYRFPISRKHTKIKLSCFYKILTSTETNVLRHLHILLINI